MKECFSTQDIDSEFQMNFFFGSEVKAVETKEVNINKEVKLCDTVISYTKEMGYGFIAKTQSPPGRYLDRDRLKAVPEGIVICETNETITYFNENNYNYGGIGFRVDVDEPGVYEIQVTIAKGTSEPIVSVSGMNGRRLLDTSTWDAAKLITRTNYADWKDNTWCYDFVTGRNYIEIELEPKLPITEKPEAYQYTVGVSSIQIRKLRGNEESEQEKPTIFTLGDSTVKSYIYEEAIMSGWGQVFDDLFDLEQVNVVNYSMGGRSVFNMYHEGRFNEILMIAKPGDYLLLQSGHNDESTGEKEGPGSRFGRGNTAESYQYWLEEVYLPSIKLRGIQLIFVTPMTRINKSSETEEDEIFSGFRYSKSPGIDFPGIMKQIGIVNQIPVVDLYEESLQYIKEIGIDTAVAMFLSVEPGETPGKTNSGSYANGNPSGSCDGTHFKETLSKQWARIVATKMSELKNPASQYLKPEVKEAIQTGSWGRVYPEISKDVITGKNAYYREQIECMCKHGIMKQDTVGNFHPKKATSIRDFVDGIKKIWDIEELSLGELKLEEIDSEELKLAEIDSDELDLDELDSELTVLDSEKSNLVKLDSEELKLTGIASDEIDLKVSDHALTREVMAAIIYVAYDKTFGRKEDGTLYKPKYMTDYNGINISPEDPNYDCNLIGESAQYYPLVGFGVIEDKEEINPTYYDKMRAVYELGLIRSEEGIERGVMKNGTRLKPKEIVTREKTAKALYFLRALKKDIYVETDK